MAEIDKRMELEFRQGIKEFLAELDASETEDERIAKVQDLIFGITTAARRAIARHAPDVNTLDALEEGLQHGSKT